MMKAILTVGISASGKSTWAYNYKRENPDIEIVCRDDLRAKFFVERFNKPFAWSLWKFKWEKFISKLADEQIEKCAMNGRSIIVADTNLNPFYRDKVAKKLNNKGFEVELKFFEISFEEACRRDAARENGVGFQVIAKQIEQWNKEFKKQYIKDDSLPKAIIVDLDGTLFDNGNRDIFDYEKCDQDEPIKEICDLVNRYKEDHVVIFLTGREAIGNCFNKTVRSIQNHVGMLAQDMVNGKWFVLMRYSGDHRPGKLVKEEIFWENVADKYNVVFAIDDHPMINMMWQSIGVKTLFVGNPFIDMKRK